MDQEHQSYFGGSLSESIIELFRDYGVDCSSISPGAAVDANADGGSEMGSIIGFKGAQLRGGLAFVAPTALIAKTLPVPRNQERGELQLRDWSGEIANQLAGRLKNKLAARALQFDVGTAVCFRGMSIKLSFVPGTEGIAMSFTIAPAGVRVYLDCSFANLTASDQDTVRIVPEGDVVLF